MGKRTRRGGGGCYGGAADKNRGRFRHPPFPKKRKGAADDPPKPNRRSLRLLEVRLTPPKGSGKTISPAFRHPEHTPRRCVGELPKLPASQVASISAKTETFARIRAFSETRGTAANRIHSAEPVDASKNPHQNRLQTAETGPT